jgi:hypothetical protein
MEPNKVETGLELFDLDKIVATIDPNVEKIRGIVALSKDITITDFEDKKQVEVVKDHWKILQQSRIAIDKKLMDIRREALDFQKRVINKKDELIDEILPEENRLKGLLDKGKELEVKKLRMAILPQRKEQLSTIGDKVEAGHELFFDEGIDEALLKMDDKAFDNYFTARMSAKNEADRKALDDEREKLAKEKQEIEDQKKIEDAKKQAKIDAEIELEEKVKRDKELKISNRKNEIIMLGFVPNEEELVYENGEFMISLSEINTDPDSEFATKVERIRGILAEKRKEKEAQAEKERKEAKEKAEQENLESEKKYNDWLEENGYTADENSKIIKEGNVVKLYKLVSTYNIK